MRYWRSSLILASLLAAVFTLTPMLVMASDELVLGRAPQVSPSTTSRNWTPFIQYLKKATGLKLNLRVYAERADFEKELSSGQLDLYFGNPGYGVVGHHLHDYQPLVRSDKKRLKGILVVRKDSNLNSLRDITGKTIVFPSKTAFAASLYLREQLTKRERLEFKAEYNSTHDNVYRSVLIGKHLAGGGVKRTLEQEPEDLRDQLKILYETPGIAPHPLMAHPRIGSKSMKAITNAIMQLDQDTEGKKILKKVKLSEPVQPDYKTDYLPIEDLALRMYEHLLK